MSLAGADRLARFRATHDPAELWPELTAPAFAHAMEAIAQASASLLGGAPASPLALPPGASAAAWGIAAFAGGMGPLLGWWHERGRLSAPAALAEVLAEHLDHGRRRAARLRAELERVLAALDGAAVPVAILKGAHTAYGYFPEPGTRPMADLDLLVTPADASATQDVLLDLGFTQHGSDSAPHRSEWVRPGTQTVHSVELDHVENPWSVELHTTLDRMYTPGVVARFGAFEIAAADLQPGFEAPARRLPQPLLMAYIACHTSNHFPQLPLMRLVELVLLAQRDFATPGAWAELEAFLTRTGTQRFAFPALSLAARFAPGTVPEPLLQRLALRTPRALRHVVRRTTPASALRFTPARPGYVPLWAATLRERVSYFAHLVWPQRADGPVGPRAGVAWQWGRLRRVLQAVLRRRT